MTEIKASEVVKLRTVTGAGMMDCKNALVESGGDFNKAIEIIREKGKAIANKRADREASEGCVLAGVSADGKKGVIVSLNCETDFVAKNENFINFTNKILTVALEKTPADITALKLCKLGDKTIEEEVIFQTGVIGEKLEIACYEQVSSEYVVKYIHPGNKLATIVAFNQVCNADAAKDIAMQVAAMSPVAVNKDGVPQDIIETELRVGKEQARLEGKPENMLEKIAEGRLNKFFKESTLLEQDFIKDQKVQVKSYLKSLNAQLTVVAFKRFTLNV